MKEQIYITSFCGQHFGDDEYYNRHGLLSQWRAYGAGGGFAIVFDTAQLEKLLQDEHKRSAYGYISLGDIVYSHDTEKLDQEFGPCISQIVSFFDRLTDTLFYEDNDPDINEDVYSAFLSCVSRYKHRGFSEENEVRIILHLIPDEHEFMKHEERPQKQINYREKNGEQIPFIKLFDEMEIKLPIKRIIVGPHKEKESRAAHLRTRLRHTQIQIDISDIPYTGI